MTRSQKLRLARAEHDRDVAQERFDKTKSRRAHVQLMDATTAALKLAASMTPQHPSRTATDGGA